MRPANEHVQANAICDVLSSERRGTCNLTSEERAGLRRIVREAKAQTEGLRALAVAAKLPLSLVAKR
jgi:hypothetical protein